VPCEPSFKSTFSWRTILPSGVTQNNSLPNFVALSYLDSIRWAGPNQNLLAGKLKPLEVPLTKFPGSSHVLNSLPSMPRT